jgi:hypothetical protein
VDRLDEGDDEGEVLLLWWWWLTLGSEADATTMAGDMDMDDLGEMDETAAGALTALDVSGVANVTPREGLL